MDYQNTALQLAELDKKRAELLQQVGVVTPPVPQQPPANPAGLLAMLPSIGTLVSRAVGQEGIAKCKLYAEQHALAGFKEACEGDDELAKIANMFYLRFFDVLKYGVNKKAPEQTGA
jgi:hypothetical protein